MTHPWTAFGCAAALLVCSVHASVHASSAADQSDPQKGDTSALGRPDWVRQDADWRLPGGARVRALHHPPHTPVLTRDRARPVRPALGQKKLEAGESSPLQNSSQTPGEVSVYTISNPPIDGFVPWIAVHATDRDQNFDYQTYFSTSVLGYYYVPNPQTTYGIGLFDTGAGISIISNQVATELGLFSAGLNCGNTVSVGGVTGSVDAWVSFPFGLWIAGLGSINPDGTLNLGNMLGEYNASAGMGQTPDPGQPDLITAIGSPMAVFMSTWIRNDLRHSVEWHGQIYEGPDISFYEAESPELPAYPTSLPLELRPTGGGVFYWPCFEVWGCTGPEDTIQYPSMIIGDTFQSLFFAGSVNCSDNGHIVQGRTKFMVDTGAQITVVGSIVGAQLGLNPNSPDFTVEIQGVDGQVAYKPGFYLDTFEIPTLGEWLSYSHVPVVLLDVASPEGGTMDGIIGMNLFLRYNIIFHGGAFSTVPGETPRIDVEPVPAINADYDYDGDVDMVDFAYLQSCFSGTDVPQTELDCAYAFLDGDIDVDTNDLLLFMQCASGPSVPAPPECRGM